MNVMRVVLEFVFPIAAHQSSLAHQVTLPLLSFVAVLGPSAFLALVARIILLARRLTDNI